MIETTKGGYMIRVLITFLLIFPTAAFAQDIKCPKGYQYYANRCVTQRMADYISCVEASGGNRQEMSEEVSEIGGNKASTGIKASGGGVIVKGSGSLFLDKASERTLAKRFETRWFPKGMSECAKVLDKATVKDIKKAIQETDQTSGVLVPDNKPIPANLACKEQIPAGDLILILGNSVAFTNTFPHTVIEIENQPLLVVDKQRNSITIMARFFSDDGRIVAELKGNKFFVNPNNYFRIERPSKHVLTVYDQRGNQALSVEFLNPSTIKLLGRFYYLPNRPPIIINEGFQDIGRGRFSGNCFGRNRVDFQL
jgi:hypothetical protein